MQALNLTEGVVHTTTDYHLFRKLNGNRPVNNAKVQKLMKSMRVKAVDIPIIINEHSEVIDGQHRVEARKRLCIPVLYTVIVGATDVEAQHVNKTGSTWKLSDHISRHITTGKQDYQVFQDFLDKHGFGTVATHMLLTGKLTRNRSDQTEAFREGRFQVVNLEEAELFADRIIGLGELGATNFKQVAFVEAFIRIFRDAKYDHEHFLRQMNKLSNLEVERTLKGVSSEVIVESVRRAYNKHLRNKEKHLLQA